jgi:ABC-type multidrug transport system fused ATPase/permease subunit
MLSKLRFDGLRSLFRCYGLFFRESKKSRFIAVQVLGFLGSFLNAVNVTSLFPFLSIFLLGRENFVAKFITPYFHQPLSPWVIDHLEIVVGLAIVGIAVAKVIILMIFVGLTSNLSEEFTALKRSHINRAYINLLGRKFNSHQRSYIVYLCGQLQQLSSFNYSLIDSTLKFYVMFGILVSMLAISWKLTLLTLLILGMIFLTGLPLYNWTRRSAFLFYDFVKKFQNQLLNFLDGAETVKTLNLLESQLARFDITSNVLIQKARWMSYSRYAIMLLPDFLVIVVCVCGALLIRPTADQLVYLGTYSYSLLKLIGALGEFNQRFNTVLELEKIPREIFNFLREAQSVPVATIEIVKVTRPISSIEFKNVRVEIGEKEILKNIHLKIERGEKIQLLGPNGSGKSTFIRCLLKLIPYEGEILINGVDIQNISNEDFYDCFGFTSQFPFLFNESIISNLVSGNSHVTDEYAKKQVHELGFDSVIKKFPDGYSTVVLENISNFSGGERQILCLLRMLLRQADVLVLDEFANHLDSKVAQQVSNQLEDTADKIILMVNHKPVTFANRTFVFESGIMKSVETDMAHLSLSQPPSLQQ